jgi:Raf kinase inhibitor-like YbhB/YbcL family protein
MNYSLKILSLIFTLLFVSCSMSQAQVQRQGFSIRSNNIIEGSTISSKHVFNGFGCTGQNLSPHISWKGAPPETKSFALTVYDPDAPTGSGWWHWVVLNIPQDYNSLPINFGDSNQFNLQNGVNQIRNDFSNFSFGGPCPPVGDRPHRYIFTIHALRVEHLALTENATAALAGYMINQSTLSKASFTAYFGR